jgi:hypothetical protein
MAWLRMFFAGHDGQMKPTADEFGRLCGVVHEKSLRAFVRGGVISSEQIAAAAMTAKAKKDNMKIQSRFVLSTVTAMTALFITQANAQYRAVGNDGIAASPNVRQMLDERQRSAAAALAPKPTAYYPGPAGDGIAASPKVRQMLDEHKVRAKAPAEVAASHSRTPVDGIAASLKVRQQLEQNSQSFQVAPD